MKMASNRISAAMKNDIRKHYDREIRDIDEKIEDIGKESAQKIIDSIHSSPEYIKFKEEANKFYSWLSESIDDDFLDSYYIKKVVDYMNSDTLLRVPYRTSLEKLFSSNEEIVSLKASKHSLNKECNQLIWNIEMSPKSSTEYKEAVAKAEDILFGDK